MKLENLQRLEKLINSELASKIQISEIKNAELLFEVNEEDLIEVIQFIKSNDECNISKIVDESGLSRSTVYKILRKLEDNNLIEAFQSEEDKRESIVSLKV